MIQHIEKSNTNLRFAIVGAGNIASAYGSSSSKFITTHSHAIKSRMGTILSGFYDVDSRASAIASEVWGGVIYSSLSHLLDDSPDVVIVCVPDKAHFSVLNQILKTPPRLVICEKPLTSSYTDSCNIVDAYRDAGVGLWTNYQRRLDPVVRDLAHRYKTKSIGKFLSGTLLHAKGIKHNGSHGIDLIRYILGEPHALTTHFRRYDYKADDPSVSGIVEYQSGSVAVLAGDERAYSIFELDLLFESGRYRFHHSGMRLTKQTPQDDPVFPGYKELIGGVTLDTGFVGSLGLLVDSVLEWFDNSDDNPICDSSNFLRTQLICELLSDSPLFLRQELI